MNRTPGHRPGADDPPPETPEAQDMAAATHSELEARLAYSVTEAAQITGLSRDLLYDQMRKGKLASLKVGRRRLITRRNLEAFLTHGAA